MGVTDERLIWQLAALAIIVSPMLLLAGIGLLWAPAAGTITAWYARRKGMPVLSAFRGGALASVLLFLPWLMLTAKLLKWRSADSLTEKSYGLVINLWIVFPIALFSIIGAYFVLVGLVFGFSFFHGEIATFSIFGGLLGAGGVWMEFVVWNRHRRWASDFSGESDQYLPSDVTALPQKHLALFAGAWLWSIIPPAYLVAFIYIGFSLA